MPAMPCLRSVRGIRIPAALLAVCLLGASCSVSYTVRLTADDIQQFLRQKLPVSVSKFLVTATVTSVQVEFVESDGGVVVRPNIEVSLVGQRLLRGHAIVSGQIRYASPTGDFFLDQAKVVMLTVEGLPDSARQAVEEVAGKCIEGYLATQPIYRLRQSDFKQSLAKLVLKSVRTRNGRLEIVVGT
jgi:hypothetical protein